jgi:hypothetical protein
MMNITSHTVVATTVLAITGSLQAKALVTHDNIKEPFLEDVFVPCANDGVGELVVISGQLHVLSHITEDMDGGFHVTIHFQPQGATGVGEDSGDVYRGVGVTREGRNVQGGGLPFVETLVNNFRIIGPGPNNNLQVHQVVHVTINDNGTLIADIDNMSAECFEE